MLRVAIPKGSLEEGVFQLFERADLSIKRGSSRDYNLKIDDPRISETIMLRPQEIPNYVEEGEFDIGITGFDWIVEQKTVVEQVADLQFSKKGWRKVKIVLATYQDNPVQKPEDIEPTARVVTEYPRLTKRFLKNLGKKRVSVRGSYGATEVKVPRLAEYLVDVVETGETLKRNNKKVLATLLESSTKLIANKKIYEDPERRREIDQITSLLLGVIESQDKTLIKMNAQKNDVTNILSFLPTLRSPTVTPFYSQSQEGDNGEWVMIETVVEESNLNLLLPELKNLGARDILEVNISKMMT